MTRICICGGGSLAHVCAGVLASHADTCVNVLTRRPGQWAECLEVRDPDGKVYAGRLGVVSSDPAEAVAGCDIVFLCLPGYAIEGELKSIQPFIGRAVVGSIVCSTGFFFRAHEILGSDASLFGFQRTPFIARLSEYGHSANLLGYKKEVAIAVENVEDGEAFRALVERLWQTPTRLLGSFYDVSLTNSNPILHTARLYSMWKDWDGEIYPEQAPFYEAWTDDASRLLIEMDSEFMRLLSVLPVSEGAVPSLLSYYESDSAEALTRKISSIQAFKGLMLPMILVKGGWAPDFSSRYFTEDFPFGLALIVGLAKEKDIDTPTLDKVLEWGMKVMDCNERN